MASLAREIAGLRKGSPDSVYRRLQFKRDLGRLPVVSLRQVIEIPFHRLQEPCSENVFRSAVSHPSNSTILWPIAHKSGSTGGRKMDFRLGAVTEGDLR